MAKKRAKDLKIGIVGVGMVGGAIRKYLEEEKNMKPFLYDTGKNLGSMEEVNKARIVFVCVPTPYRKEKGGFDLSYVKETCEKLTGKKVIVIKSTVVPGTTEKLQEEYPQHKFIFNPEFLVESRAYQDFKNPNRQIIGYTDESYDFANIILEILPDAPFNKKVSASEAELVKYFGNTFLATKVIFATQIYNLCRELDLNYDRIKEMALGDPRIGNSHLDIFHGGYKGYFGKCFPKDMKALIQFADKHNIDLELLKKADEINEKLLDEQNIEDPETLSKRN